MTKISRWAADNVTRLARALENTPEATGSALDNSLVSRSMSKTNAMSPRDP